MSRWEEEYKNHPVHEALRQLREWVESREDELQPNEAPERRRFLKVIDALDSALAGVDKELVAKNHLDSLNNNLRNQNLWNPARAYYESGQLQHLINANNNLVGPLGNLPTLQALAKPEFAEIDIERVEGELDRVSRKILETESQSLARLDEIDDSVSHSKDSLADIKSQMESRRSEVNSQLSEWQSQFSQSQDRRSEEYVKWRDKLSEDAEEKINRIVEAAKSDLAESKDNFFKAVNSILGDSKEKHAAILELYELVAGDSVSAGYLTTADEEKKQANLWRWISVGFVIATVLWLGLAYLFPPYDFARDSIVWPKLVTVFSISGVLLFGAIFSSRQSNRHRENERRSKWFALQVKAIDPFLSSLDKANRNKIKSILSERLFANTERMAGGSEGYPSDHISEELLGKIADSLAEMASKNSN